MPKSELVGKGNYSRVIRPYGEKSYLHRIPNHWNANQARKEMETHDRLIALSVPTIPEYDADFKRRYVRMTDLTDNGSLFVASAADLLGNSADEAGTDAKFKGLIKSSSQNGAQFFVELKQILETTRAADINVLHNGYFLICTPEGQLRTVIADYHDGISVDVSKRAFGSPLTGLPGEFGDVADYLKIAVLRYFPELKQMAYQFMSEVCPEPPDAFEFEFEPNAKELRYEKVFGPRA